MIAQLHVAAMPHPTPQGTQAAVAAVMDALVDRDAALLTYAHGDGSRARGRHLRIARSFGDRSLRSGPSIPKLAQDLALAAAITGQRAGVVIAHHVEAAMASLLAGARPWVFVAHTALGPELPTYFPRALAPLAARAGEHLDDAIARRAGAVLAISPRLAQQLRERTGVGAEWLPIPWSIPAPITEDERARARAARGIDARARTVLYAGNLDRYQGLDTLLGAIGRSAELQLRIATASDPSTLRREIAAAGIAERTIFERLDGTEAQRRELHAAADVVAVPRAAEGGLPIKMIDALARGAPVAAVHRACAGLALERELELAADDDPVALSIALERAIATSAPERARGAHRGRDWIAEHFAAERCAAALDRAIDRARSRSAGDRASRRPR